MPFYYDVNRITGGTNGSANTLSTHLWVKTAANQDSMAIKGIYAAARFNTAGGAQLIVSHNTGVTASGGTAQTPAPRNLRGNPAAQSIWANDATAITAGATLVGRVSIGFAQTGGMGGWVAIEPAAAIVMMPNATNPIDVDFQSKAATASVPFDMTVEFSEGT